MKEERKKDGNSRDRATAEIDGRDGEKREMGVMNRYRGNGENTGEQKRKQQE